MIVKISAQFQIESTNTFQGCEGARKISQEFTFDFTFKSMSDYPPLPIDLEAPECLNLAKHIMSKIRSESQGILFRIEND